MTTPRKYLFYAYFAELRLFQEFLLIYPTVRRLLKKVLIFRDRDSDMLKKEEEEEKENHCKPYLFYFYYENAREISVVEKELKAFTTAFGPSVFSVRKLSSYCFELPAQMFKGTDSSIANQSYISILSILCL